MSDSPKNRTSRRTTDKRKSKTLDEENYKLEVEPRIMSFDNSDRGQSLIQNQERKVSMFS